MRYATGPHQSALTFFLVEPATFHVNGPDPSFLTLATGIGTIAEVSVISNSVTSLVENLGVDSLNHAYLVAVFSRVAPAMY